MGSPRGLGLAWHGPCSGGAFFSKVAPVDEMSLWQWICGESLARIPARDISSKNPRSRSNKARIASVFLPQPEKARHHLLCCWTSRIRQLPMWHGRMPAGPYPRIGRFEGTTGIPLSKEYSSNLARIPRWKPWPWLVDGVNATEMGPSPGLEAFLALDFQPGPDSPAWCPPSQTEASQALLGCVRWAISLWAASQSQAGTIRLGHSRPAEGRVGCPHNTRMMDHALPFNRFQRDGMTWAAACDMSIRSLHLPRNTTDYAYPVTMVSLSPTSESTCSIALIRQAIGTWALGPGYPSLALNARYPTGGKVQIQAQLKGQWPQQRE
ncbi:hypothetical protein FDECE_18058 [Fusarium decemcellulare]|nr:hypothetical protein FDECE_18058 [Fusarium decemcellulare]